MQKEKNLSLQLAYKSNGLIPENKVELGSTSSPAPFIDLSLIMSDGYKM